VEAPVTTTFELIRNQQCSVIEALTPTRHAGKKFQRHVDQAEFTDWATQYPAACLRRFQILSNFDIEQGPTADGSIEACSHTMELRIAYPMHAGLYGSENQRDMEDMLSADLHQIDAAIGLNGFASYVTNQDLCRKESSSVLQFEKTSFLSVVYRVQYDRSV
jgi:hypothetical protein